MFTQDPSQRDCVSLQGDALCALAAIFYATYDLRLFKWGKQVPTNELITTKMVTQSILSIILLFVLGQEETQAFISQVSTILTTFHLKNRSMNNSNSNFKTFYLDNYITKNNAESLHHPSHKSDLRPHFSIPKKFLNM